MSISKPPVSAMAQHKFGFCIAEMLNTKLDFLERGSILAEDKWKKGPYTKKMCLKELTKINYCSRQMGKARQMEKGPTSLQLIHFSRNCQ